MRIIRIGIIAKIKGGKGTVEKYIGEVHGAESVRFSTPLREMHDVLHIPNSRENLQNISTYLRQRYGEEVIGAEIIRRLNGLKSRYQLIDGIRRPADMVALRKDPFFRSVYVRASLETRHQRQLAFPENPGDAEMSFQEFCRRDAAEAESDIEAVGQQAHYRIDNDGITKEAYLTRFEEILEEMRALPDPPGT